MENYASTFNRTEPVFYMISSWARQRCCIFFPWKSYFSREKKYNTFGVGAALDQRKGGRYQESDIFLPKVNQPYYIPLPPFP